MVHNLKQRAVSGGAVTIAAQLAKFVLNLLSAAVFARLLPPKEFGLVGMVFAVMGVLEILKGAGLSTATIQKEVINQEQVSNLFWINVALGAVMCLISIATAPLVAWFYQDAQLTGIMRALSFTFLLTGASVQHRALLMRQMQFGALAVIDVASTLVSIVVGCWLAMLGSNHWSLVAVQLTAALAGLVFTWWKSGWRPSLRRLDNSVLPLVSFGLHLTISDLIAKVADNSDGILVGRFFGAGPLGLYTRAYVLFARPLEQIFAPLNSVMVPVLSRLRSEPEQYRRTFLRAYDSFALITFCFAGLCLVLAEPIILVILGPKWTKSAPLFAGFSLVALSVPLSGAPSWLFMSQGRGRDSFYGWAISGPLAIVACFVGLRWGPLGVVLSLAVASMIFRLPIIFYLAGRCGPVRSVDLWMTFLWYLPCWAAVCIATKAVHQMIFRAAPLVQLVVCVPAGLAAGALVVLALRRPRTNTVYMWNAIRHLMD